MNWIRSHLKVLGGVLVGLLLIMGLLWQRCGIKGCPDVGRLKGYMPDEASTIMDYRGQEVGKLFLTRRFLVQLDSMPDYVPKAFVAIEDQRFFKHGGVDWKRVGGAFVTNVKRGGIKEGSSTITMQLARNAFPDQLPANQRTIWRKIAEARVARAIEKQYSKNEILQLYLNQIYFGNGAYGIEAAAQEYFGHGAAKLSLAEAATLAALPRAPSRYNPRSNKQKAYEGRKEVLSRMAEQGMITADEAEKAATQKVKLRRGNEKTNTIAPYFVEAMREILEDQLGDAIYSKGYKIYTTLDGQMQRVLEDELSKQLLAIERGAFGSYRHTTMASAMADTADDDKGTKYLQTAAIFMDPTTGDVRALVGGRNFQDSEFNRAVNAQRQPGSTFKPFVYAAAFAEGYAPTYRIPDQPIRMVLSRKQVWEPKNFDGGYSGVVTMRDALAHSKNVPTVRLAMEIGISRIIDMARQMGLSGRIPAVPSVVLGTADVTPMEMTQAFAAFANLGDRPSFPRYVTKVVDRDGNIVWSQEPETRNVIDDAVAFETVSLMQDVVDRGTATTVRAAGYRYPAAGKTGTTNDGADTWFIGITPHMVGTIWIGLDKRQTIVPHATGGELAAPVWGRVMARMNVQSAGWAPPPGIEMRMIDANGNVLGDNCPAVGATRKEYFIQGTAPISTCYPAYDQYSYYDTTGLGMPDTTGMGAVSDDGWWARMRARVFGNKPVYEPVPTPRRDSLPPLRGEPVDTAKPKPAPVPYDSVVKPKPDTAKPPPDTTQISH